MREWAAGTGNRASRVWENMAERRALSYCGSWYNVDRQGVFSLFLHSLTRTFLGWLSLGRVFHVI